MQWRDTGTHLHRLQKGGIDWLEPNLHRPVRTHGARRRKHFATEVDEADWRSIDMGKFWIGGSAGIGYAARRGGIDISIPILQAQRGQYFPAMRQNGSDSRSHQRRVKGPCPKRI